MDCANKHSGLLRGMQAFGPGCTVGPGYRGVPALRPDYVYIFSGPLAVSDSRNLVFVLFFWLIFGQTWPQNPSRTTGSSCSVDCTKKSARQTNSKAISWHSRILGFYHAASARKPSESSPEGRIPARRTRENLSFILEGSRTSAPGWRAGWGTSFGTLRVSG